MKRLYSLVLCVSLFISGCGVDWFPDKTSTSTTTAGATSLAMAFSPAVMLAGTDPAVTNTSSTLTFTITNGTGNPAHSGLGFVDTLPAGLTVSGTLTNATQCGGTVSNPGGLQLVFAGGSLAAGATSCTVTATVTGATAGSFTNKATDITGLAGGLVNSAADKTLKVVEASRTATTATGTVTASHIETLLVSSDAVNALWSITVDVANSSPTAAAAVTLDVIAVDASGADINSTITVITGTVAPGGLISLLQTNPTVSIPLAVSNTIQLWRIFSVAAQ